MAKRCRLERFVIPALTASETGVLPLDAVYEILLRVPAKDLCRLRAVCRRWRSLLSDPQFIAAHGARHPGPLIIASYLRNAEHDVLVDIIDLSGQKIKKVLRKQGDYVASMVLDLICVKNSGVCKLLNPATGSVHQLPQNYAQRACVFGQVPRTKEYKVLQILVNDLFQVCTLCSGSPSRWRTKQGPPIRLLPAEHNIVLIDGTLYFLSLTAYFGDMELGDIEQEWVVPFDLETEEWRPNIKGPSTFGNDDPDDDPDSRQLSLANLNGSLVIVDAKHMLLDLWFLIDIEKGLWVKQYSFQAEKYGTEFLNPSKQTPVVARKSQHCLPGRATCQGIKQTSS